MLDRDDARWRSEAEFTAALRDIGRDSSARAVVIRSAASLSSRRHAVETVRASDVVVLVVPADECVRRVTARGRPNMRTQIRAVADWFARYEAGDVAAGPPMVTSRRWM